MTFATRLDEALDRLGWNARDLSDAAVISEPHVSEIRSGRRRPSLAVALQIAEVTGWSLDSLTADAPLGEPDFERLKKPSWVATKWQASIKALVDASSLPAVARKVQRDHSAIHAYLRGVEPRLDIAIWYAQRLGQSLHEMAIGRPRLP